MKQEIQGKLYLVAELLGAKVMPSYSDNCRYLAFGNTTSWRCLKIYVAHRWGKADDVYTVCYESLPLYWEQGELCRISDEIYIQTHKREINVNMTRSAADLAKDITRRLLNGLADLHKNHTERMQADIDYTRKVNAFKAEWDNYPYATNMAEIKYVSADKADILIRGTHDQIRQLVAYVKGLIGD